MKRLSTVFISLLALSTMACEGPTGPEGNANVKTYEFGARTFTGLTNFTIEIPKSTVDSSAVFVYYNPSNESASAWYSVPGLGSTNSYQTRYTLYQTDTDPSTYTLALRTVNPNGVGSYATQVTFTKTKIVFIKSSEVTMSPDLVAPSYETLRNRFNLPE